MQNLRHKIIFLFCPGPMGGAEKVVLKGLEALQSAHNDVELWLIKEKRFPKLVDNFVQHLFPAIKVRVFETSFPFDLNLAMRLKLELNKDRYLIHAHGFKAAFYARLTYSRHSKLIVTHHGRTAHTFKVRLYEKLESIVMKNSDAVIAVSEKMKNDLNSEGINKLFLVENILALNLPAQKPISSKSGFVFIGRLSPEKGCDVLIKAILQLAPEERPKLKIIGEGYERQNLIDLVAMHKLEPWIQFKGFQKDIAPFLAEAAALVMPSLREGQPLSLIEACCAGIPVIASRTGGIPELITDGENGLLCEPGSVEALSSKIREFNSSQFKIRENSEMMADIFIKRFSSENWVKKTMNVYDRVLSQ